MRSRGRSGAKGESDFAGTREQIVLSNLIIFHVFGNDGVKFRTKGLQSDGIGSGEGFHHFDHSRGGALQAGPKMLRAERRSQDRLPVECNVSNSRTEALANDLRIAPLHGRGNSRRGRQVASGKGCGAADEQFRGPSRKCERAPAF